VEAFAGAKLDEPAASALALLALVAGQDVEPAGGSDGTDGRWRIARRVAEDRVISTVDPDARHTRKSPEARRDGYRAHIAACPETGIITGEELTKAAGQENSDPAVAEEFLAAEAGQEDPGPAADTASHDSPGSEPGGEPLAWYGDSAYGTGDLRGAIAGAGHRAVIKPKPLQAPVKGGLTIDDFTVDEQAGTVTCPAGNIVALSRTRIATFGVLCRDCPLRERCTTCKTGRKLVLHPRDDLLRAARADWAADARLRKDYAAWRPNVERAVAQVATWRGRRLKLRYRGVTRNHAWLKRRTAALNLRNLVGKGLARRDGAWVLAT
jgi:DDE family transposase